MFLEVIKMAKKVTIDSSKCIGCGACTGICASVFTISPATGLAEVAAEPTDADTEAVENAAASCPGGAIEVK